MLQARKAIFVHSDKFAGLVQNIQIDVHTKVLFKIKEASNPNSNLQSFDTIYFAALEVIIVASANGVRHSSLKTSAYLLITSRHAVSGLP